MIRLDDEEDMHRVREAARASALRTIMVGRTRLATSDLAGGAVIPLGNCGDAWRLRAVGDADDVVDHRPYVDRERTPAGLCADAPLLVLYPERGAVDWPALLGDAAAGARPGHLASGVDVLVIHLSDADWYRLGERGEIGLDEIRRLAKAAAGTGPAV